MTNYVEEQQNEIEALESIYANEFAIIEREPHPKFSIKVSTDDYEDNEVKLTATIEFAFTPKYPDEVPTIEITEYEDDFIDDYKKQLEDLLKEESTKNIGMVMIFTLVSVASEWMTTRVEDRKEEIRTEAERKQKELEEAEHKKFEGTRVTLESFLEWKRKYAEETGRAAKAKQLEQNKKLTGRQLFEKDESLVKSDLEFLKDDEAVCVDESLFQDLDDLDLDDESDESEFDPDDLTSDSD